MENNKNTSTHQHDQYKSLQLYVKSDIKNYVKKSNDITVTEYLRKENQYYHMWLYTLYAIVSHSVLMITSNVLTNLYNYLIL